MIAQSLTLFSESFHFKGDNLMFRILESRESKVAASALIVLLPIAFIVHYFFNIAAINQLLIPLAGLVLGCIAGWLLGEALVQASGTGKFLLAGLSILFGATSLDALRQRLETSREKIFYLLSLLPVTNPYVIEAAAWFAGAFLLVLLSSVAINFIRRKEAEQPKPDKKQK
jgi:hypothetical protein